LIFSLVRFGGGMVIQTGDGVVWKEIFSLKSSGRHPRNRGVVCVGI